jgi:hypothetical protein
VGLGATAKIPGLYEKENAQRRRPRNRALAVYAEDVEAGAIAPKERTNQTGELVAKSSSDSRSCAFTVLKDGLEKAMDFRL